MVLRNSDRRFVALVAVCIAAASLTDLAGPAMAQATGSVYAQGAATDPGGRMVWGGRLPDPGEAYRPSVGRRDGTGVEAPSLSGGRSQPQQAAPDDMQRFPAPAPPAANPQSLYDDLVGRAGSSYAAEPPSGQGTSAGGILPPPLSAPVPIDAQPSAGGGSAEPASRRADPWADLKKATPDAAVPAAPLPAPLRAPAQARGRVAALGTPEIRPAQPQLPDRGALQPETPDGYILLPKREAMCRIALKKIGVKYTDISPIGSAGSCGIAHPVKVTQIAEGVAMKPAATLNCDAAFRISQWVENEVKPAARWRMWTRPTAVINASSYRCSRIAGSRTISEHASGNALDVAGFVFSNGDIFDVNKKGFFSFREKGFQRSVRQSACEYFGTVLGPGYNYDHRDHLHLDAKNRRRVVCK